MPLIAVTRLRAEPRGLRPIRRRGIAVVEQAKATVGNLGADTLAAANNTYWTRTAWRDVEAMQDFMDTEPHLTAMDHIDEQCDEATFVNCDQPEGELPDRQSLTEA
jgi:hypothetical protein